jgi:hypothetical protein
MTHLMADGKRVCGRPDGHTGKHYAEKTVAREAERMRLRRTTPGPCTVKDCDSNRYQYDTGTYDVRCWRHADLHVARRKVAAAREARSLAYQEAWELAYQEGRMTREEIDEAIRRMNATTRQPVTIAFTAKSNMPVS